MQHLRNNGSLTISGSRDQVDAFLRRRGVAVPPTPPGLVLFGILMLGMIAAWVAAPILTFLVALLLLVTGHLDLVIRYGGIMLLGFGAGTCGAVILLKGRGMWRRYQDERSRHTRSNQPQEAAE